MAELERGPTSEAGRIAKFMGLSSWRKLDDIGLVNRVRDGFPFDTANTVVKRIDPGGRFVKVTDIIPKTTLHRRKNQALTKDESEKILSLSKMFSELLRLYHDDTERVAIFLIQKHPMIDNRRPIDLAIESIAGCDLVIKLLAKADAGIAA